MQYTFCLKNRKFKRMLTLHSVYFDVYLIYQKK